MITPPSSQSGFHPGYRAAGRTGAMTLVGAAAPAAAAGIGSSWRAGARLRKSCRQSTPGASAVAAAGLAPVASTTSRWQVAAARKAMSSLQRSLTSIHARRVCSALAVPSGSACPPPTLSSSTRSDVFAAVEAPAGVRLKRGATLACATAAPAKHAHKTASRVSGHAILLIFPVDSAHAGWPCRPRNLLSFECHVGGLFLPPAVTLTLRGGRTPDCTPANAL